MTSMVTILADFARYGVPTTLEEHCASAARTALRALGCPKTEADVFACALGLAQGLWDHEWGTATEATRWTWIDMCEVAIRDAIRAPP